MKFIPKKTVRDALVGHIKVPGILGHAQIPVYHDRLNYYCEFKGERIEASGIDGLIALLTVSDSEELVWQDIIKVSNYDYSNKEHIEFTMNHTRMHMARRADGSWVWSPWSPETAVAARSRRVLGKLGTMTSFPTVSGTDYYVLYTEEKWQALVDYRAGVESDRAAILQEMLK